MAASDDPLMVDIDAGIAKQRATAEYLRKHPIDLKKYKGKIQRFDFTPEPVKKPSGTVDPDAEKGAPEGD